MGHPPIVWVIVVRSLGAVAALLLITLPAGAGVLVATERPSRTSALEADLLLRINGLRAQHGRARLAPSPGLRRAAAAHSTAMARRGFFGHGLGDDGVSERLRRSYPSRPGRPWSVGENLLWSSPHLDAQEAVTMWLAGPMHRRILLDPRWRDVGLAAVHVASAPGIFGGREVTIVTADFGVRD